MSDRDVRDYIEDILAQIEKIEAFTTNIQTVETFQANELVAYACIRAFEIMGEAVKHIPDDLRQNYPQVPWRTIAGFRDVLIHAYFGIDYRVVWNAIHQELPPFKPVFRTILQALPCPEVRQSQAR